MRGHALGRALLSFHHGDWPESFTARCRLAVPLTKHPEARCSRSCSPHRLARAAKQPEEWRADSFNTGARFTRHVSRTAMRTLLRVYLAGSACPIRGTSGSRASVASPTPPTFAGRVGTPADARRRSQRLVSSQPLLPSETRKRRIENTARHHL